MLCGSSVCSKLQCYTVSWVTTVADMTVGPLAVAVAILLVVVMI